MKKILFYSGAFILACIALTNLLPLAGLLVSGVIVAAGVHYYNESMSTSAKIVCGTVIVIGLLSALSNFPAFVGLLAIVALYYMYKNVKGERTISKEDPFTNFEKEWANLHK